MKKIFCKKSITGLFLAGVLTAGVFVAGCAPKNTATDANAAVEEVAVTEVSTQASAGAQEFTATGLFGDFSAQTLDGETVTPDVLKGSELTMLNIWGTFCSPCISEMPELAKLSEKYADKGFKIVGLIADTAEADGSAYEPNVKLAKEIVQKAGANYTNIIPDKLLYDALGAIEAVPTTIFFNKDGVVVDTVVGSNDFDGWSKTVESLLNKAQA